MQTAEGIEVAEHNSASVWNAWDQATARCPPEKERPCCTSHNYVIDAVEGVVYGRSGKRVGSVKARGYVDIHAGRSLYLKAHRVIWEAVNGPIPSGKQINHINGIKHDNRISNLELVTASENLQHAYRLGLADARGEKNGRAIGKRRAIAKAQEAA